MSNRVHDYLIIRLYSDQLKMNNVRQMTLELLIILILMSVVHLCLTWNYRALISCSFL